MTSPLQTEPRATKPDAGGGDAGGKTGNGRDDGGGGGRGKRHESGPPISNEKFAMWLLLCSLVMLFAGFLAAYTVLRFGAESWPPPGMPALPKTLFITTAILLASSVSMQWSFVSARHGNLGALKAGLSVTTLLGIAFLVGQMLIWQGLHLEGLTLANNVYGAIFYTLTGVHAAHIVGGIVFLLFVTGRSLMEQYGPDEYTGVELCAMYWHFVDLVWIGLLAALLL